MRILSALAVVTVSAFSSLRASTPAVIVELEPNSTKATATVVACLSAGDAITGVSAGTSTLPGDATPLSADCFRIRTCALPAGVYRHRLTLTTTGPVGHQLTILGLDAVGAPPTITSNDAAIQNSSALTSPPCYVQWYGFGRSEELFLRVTGLAATVAPYQLTLSSTLISVAPLPGPLLAGQITLTTEGQGHSTDTEIKVYDAGLHPIFGFANDDTPAALPGGGTQFQSTLQRAFAPGTYVMLLSRYNMADDLLPGVDDQYQGGDVVDFPDLVLSSDTTLGGSNVSFAITDSAGTTAVAAVLPSAPYEVLWYSFVVGQAWSIAPYCFGDSSGFGCPCVNNGLYGHGCANSVNAFGAQLVATGVPSVGGDTFTLSGTGMPNGFAMYFQGTGAAQSIYGDGILCVGGAIVRLGLEGNGAGASHYPSGSDLPVSVSGGSVVGGGYRYQAWYRDSPPYCLPATFNMTNGVVAFWAP